MKGFSLIVMVAIIGFSCNNKAGKATQTGAQLAQQKATVPTFELDSLISIAEHKVNDTIKVRGYVTHTCKHAGKRCFIVGESQSVSLRVEAKGDIGGFNRELTGSKLEITGVLKERRLSLEYLEQSEKDLNQKMVSEDGSAESCSAELNNIAKMKEKMKEMGKDYYALYFVDGLKYDIVE